MKYWVNLLKSIDQFFNTLAGGNPDCTLSGHIGFMSAWDNDWIWLANLVDYTFAPIEQNHCTDSYMCDDDADNTDNLYRTAFFAVLGCLLLFIPIRIMARYGTSKS